MATPTKAQKAYRDAILGWPEGKQVELLPILRDLLTAGATDELGVEFTIAGRIEEWIAEHEHESEEEERMVREIYAENLLNAYQALSPYPAERIIPMIDADMGPLAERENVLNELFAMEPSIRRIYANLNDRTKYIIIMFCRLFPALSEDSGIISMCMEELYRQLIDDPATFLASAGKRFANDPQIADLVQADPLVRILLYEE